MDPAVMQVRQQAYQQILTRGLLALRDAAWAGKAKLCAIEADHLHNLPSLLDEPNEKRHHYYIATERKAYLEALERLGETAYRQEQMRRYREPWMTLMKAALPELEAGNAAALAALLEREQV